MSYESVLGTIEITQFRGPTGGFDREVREQYWVELVGLDGNRARLQPDHTHPTQQQAYHLARKWASLTGFNIISLRERVKTVRESILIDTTVTGRTTSDPAKE